jgi:hypothetical protein
MQCDRFYVQDASSGLNYCQEANCTRLEMARFLELGQPSVDVRELHGLFNLRNHDCIECWQGDSGDVLGHVESRVHANHQVWAVRSGATRRQDASHVLSRDVFLGRRNGILEIEDDGVGAKRLNEIELALTAAGGVQQTTEVANAFHVYQRPASFT